MIRQIYDALRFAVADFFEGPWQSVVSMLLVIVLLGTYAFLRTNYSMNSRQLLQLLLFVSVFVALAVAGKHLNRR